MKYSIVIPCYKSSGTIQKVVSLTMREMEGKDIEFVLVNDASPDNGKTYQAIKEMSKMYGNVLAIDLAQNAGQHNALMAALNYVQGDYVIAMDDDMQTHPSQIHKLLEEMDKGYDIVYAYYPHKKHKWYRNIGSAVNSWTVRKLIGKPKALKTSSFWIIKRFVCDYVVQYKNAYSYMQGLFLRTTRNIQSIPVEHFEREIGSSNYTLRSLLHLWSNIIGFSVVPLRMASIIGAAFSLMGIIGAAVTCVRKILFQTAVQGWSSLMVILCFFSGILLLFMGLIGEYIGRMFLSSNNQPQYVVREVSGRIGNEKIDDSGSRDISGSAAQAGTEDGTVHDCYKREGTVSGI